jgi:hypothetical protein
MPSEFESGAGPFDRWPDATLDELLQTVLGLRAAGIAHGALGSETIIVSPAGDVGLKNFRRASSSAPDARLGADLAAVLAAIAVRVGTERTAAAAGRVLDADTARGALVHLQRSGLDPVTVDAVCSTTKSCCPSCGRRWPARPASRCPSWPRPSESAGPTWYSGPAR